MNRWTQNTLTMLASLLLAPAALILATGLAWQLLSLVDFGYPQLYRLLDIQAHIAEYGPQNRYRKGFARLSPAEHQALFAGIVDAVNHDGEGLTALHYRPPEALAPIPLLRPPEIKHLELVANWVTRLRRATIIAGFGVLIVVLWLRQTHCRPRALGLGAGGGLVLAAVGAFTAAAFDAGSGGWFARLHEWAFPPGHQWFFYYQESLMTTLMKAPDLFGPMAAELAILTLTLTLAIVIATQWVLRDA